MRKWYQYRFADGYRVQQAGMSAQERKTLEAKHGKLTRKEVV